MRARAWSIVFVAALSLGCSSGAGGRLAVADFEHLPQRATPSEVGRLVSENLLRRPYVIAEDGGLHYREVVAAYGALGYAGLAKDDALLGRLVARYASMLTDETLLPKRAHVDDYVFGIVPLEIYLQTRDERYLALGLRFADRQFEDLREDGLPRQTRFWIDDMFMVGCLQIEAFRATGRATYADRTALFLTAYLDKLQQPDGLFRHGETSSLRWGRGNGWVASALTEALRSLPVDHPGRPRLLAGYIKMMDALVKHQAPDGVWLQVIDDASFWPETSSTAMFTNALATGAAAGWLVGPQYEVAARKGYIGLMAYLDPEGNLSEVCEGTGQKDDPEFYRARKRIKGDFHGQAPLLWTVNGLLRRG